MIDCMIRLRLGLGLPEMLSCCIAPKHYGWLPYFTSLMPRWHIMGLRTMDVTLILIVAEDVLFWISPPILIPLFRFLSICRTYRRWVLNFFEKILHKINYRLESTRNHSSDIGLSKKVDTFRNIHTLDHVGGFGEQQLSPDCAPGGLDHQQNCLNILTNLPTIV